MPSIGRENIWADSPQLWTDIDNAVKEEVGRIRVLQKVFPGVLVEGADVPDPSMVSGASSEPVMMVEGQTLPLVEIASTFALTQTQLEQEAKLRTARQLARRAARHVAVEEDRLFLAGGKAKRGTLRNAKTVREPLRDAGTPLAGVHASLFDGLVAAIEQLADDDHPGPYALFAGTQAYADAHSPLPATLITEADRIRPLVESGFLTSSTLGKLDAILVSLGGETVSMYIGTDATTQFLQWDGDGNAQFRVFERVRLVVREPDAVVPFTVAERGGAGRQGASPGPQAPSQPGTQSQSVQLAPASSRPPPSMPRTQGTLQTQPQKQGGHAPPTPSGPTPSLAGQDLDTLPDDSAPLTVSQRGADDKG